MRKPDRHDRNRADRINRIWNAFVRGREIATGSEEDELTRVIEHLHARNSAPHVDSTFAAQLLNSLTAQHPATSPTTKPPRHGRSNVQTHLAGSSNSSDWPAPPPRRLTNNHSGTRGRSRWTDLIAIAAVVLLVFGTVIADRRQSSNDPAFQLATSTPATTSAGESADSMMFRGNATRTGEMPGPGPVGDPELAWTRQVGVGTFQPLVAANKRLFFIEYSASTQSYELHAIDLETGDDLWSTTLSASDNLTPAVPAVANGLVYVSTSTGLEALEAGTGKQRWTYAFQPRGTIASPVISDGFAYFGDSGNTLHALDAYSGNLVWEVSIPDKPSHDNNPWGGEHFAVVDGKVFGRGYNGLVFALDARSGAVVWKTSLEGNALEPFLVSDDAVMVTTIASGPTKGTRPVRLHALNVNNGSELWDPVVLTSPSTLAASDGALFVADSLDDTGNLQAYDIRTGKPLWSWQGQGPLRSPAVVNGSLYVAAGDGAVYGINALSGTSDWMVRLGRVNDPLVIDGLLIATGFDTIYAVKGGGYTGSLGADQATPDLSGLAPCEPPRTPPAEQLSGNPAATINTETFVNEHWDDNPPITIDGRPLESTNWPQILDANIPAGETATNDQATHARQVIAEMSACAVRDQIAEPLTCFFSDDFFRRDIATWDTDGYTMNWSIQPDEERMSNLRILVLDDGRVAASAVSGRGYGSLMIFVEEDGVWLVDEAYSVVPQYFDGPQG